MRPQFQARNYGDGLLDGIQTFASYVGERFNFTFADLDRQQASGPLSANNVRSVETTLVQLVDYRTAQISRLPEMIAASTRAADEKNSSATTPESNAKTKLTEPVAVAQPVAAKTAAGRVPIMLPSEKALPVRIPRFKTRPVID